MENNEILSKILNELKKHTEILEEHTKEIKSIKKAVSDLDNTVNKWVFEEMERLEKKLTTRIEAIERKIG